jgi:hypothetical protein
LRSIAIFWVNLPTLLLFGFIRKPQSYSFGHFPHLLMPVIEATKETEVFRGGFGWLGFVVNDIKTSNLLLVSSQSK